MGIKVRALDHLVLTCRDIEVSIAFYCDLLGMRRESFGEGRVAVRFGRQKLNLHPHPTPHGPLVARVAEPGTADLCFLIEGSLEDAELALQRADVPIEKGPIERTGATGPIRSLYVRDPDGNLVELSVEDEMPAAECE